MARPHTQLFGGARHYVFHLGGGVLGGRGALPANNTPAQQKTPLTPPPLLNLALGGVLSRISDFREPPPPLV